MGQRSRFGAQSEGRTGRRKSAFSRRNACPSGGRAGFEPRHKKDALGAPSASRRRLRGSFRCAAPIAASSVRGPVPAHDNGGLPPAALPFVTSGQEGRGTTFKSKEPCRAEGRGATFKSRSESANSTRHRLPSRITRNSLKTNTRCTRYSTLQKRLPMPFRASAPVLHTKTSVNPCQVFSSISHSKQTIDAQNKWQIFAMISVYPSEPFSQISGPRGGPVHIQWQFVSAAAD